MNVIPIRRCGRCKERLARDRVLVLCEGSADERVLVVRSCDECWDRTLLELVEEREIFYSLIEMGVSRTAADAMLLAKHACEG